MNSEGVLKNMRTILKFKEIGSRDLVQLPIHAKTRYEQ